MPEPCSYDYAVIRVVPNVMRQEFINAGGILFCRTRRLLVAQIHLDVHRLTALAPEIDLDAVQRHLNLIPAICAGEGPSGNSARRRPFTGLSHRTARWSNVRLFTRG